MLTLVDWNDLDQLTIDSVELRSTMLEKEEKKKRKRKQKIEIYLRQYLISFIILIKYNIFIYFLNRKLEILIKSSNRYLNT